MNKLHFPSQSKEYTGTTYSRNRWRRTFDHGKALEQWKAMNDAENERRERLGLNVGTQSLPVKQINEYHERELEQDL